MIEYEALKAAREMNMESTASDIGRIAAEGNKTMKLFDNVWLTDIADAINPTKHGIAALRVIKLFPLIQKIGEAGPDEDIKDALVDLQEMMSGP